MIFGEIEYQLMRTNRRTLAIEVSKDGTVKVRAPLKLPQSDIEAFLNKKRTWILRAVDKQKNRTNFFDISKDEIKRLRSVAQEIIPKKVAHFGEIMQLTPTSVHITTAKTRFGSCSGKNSLNFSCFLMLFPKEAIDYVVVHELAHIRYHNHSKEFYKLIEKYMPDYKERVKLLKR